MVDARSIAHLAALRDWMQFTPETRGLFTTGGSMPILNAIAHDRVRVINVDADIAARAALVDGWLSAEQPTRVL